MYLSKLDIENINLVYDHRLGPASAGVGILRRPFFVG